MTSKRTTPAMERTRTPGVYKRGGRYVVVTYERGRQRKNYHRTYEEAREAKGEAMRQGSRRSPITRATFAGYAADFIETYAGQTARGISPTTLAAHRKVIEDHAVPFFGPQRLRDIEPQDVRRLVGKLGEDRTPGTVKKYMQPIRALFSQAHADGALPSNPVANVRVPRGSGGEQHAEAEPARALTGREWIRLRSALSARWLPLFDLIYETGLRVSEALGLDWCDVRLGERPTLAVRRQFYRGDLRDLKTTAGRRNLPLSQAAAQWVFRSRPASGTGPMFASRNGTRLMYRNVRRAFDKAAEDAGLEGITIHTLRHTAASRLLNEGKTIVQVAGWLGHADAAFTLRTYTHLIDADLGDALAPVGNTWAMQGPGTAANADSSEAAERAA